MAVFSSLVPLLLLFLSVSSPYVNGKLENNCSIMVQNMATCLPFVTIGSQVDKPDASCCSGLKTVLDTKAECLCTALKKSASTVNIIKAATLPAVCKLDATPYPSPSPHSSHGSSLIPVSGLTFAITGALVILFSRI